MAARPERQLGPVVIFANHRCSMGYQRAIHRGRRRQNACLPVGRTRSEPAPTKDRLWRPVVVDNGGAPERRPRGSGRDRPDRPHRRHRPSRGSKHGGKTQRRAHPDLQPRQLRARPPAPLPRDRARAGRPLQGRVGPDPVRLAHHRQLRFPRPRRFRPHPRRDQAARRRIPVARPAHRSRADDGNARRDHPPDRAQLPARPVPGRQGAARPPGRGDGDAADAEGHGDDARARLARHHGRSHVAAPRVAAQERASGAGEPLRRDLGLRPQPLRRSARRRRVPAGGAPEDGLHGLSAARRSASDRGARSADRRAALCAGHRRRRRRRHAVVDWVLRAYENDPDIPLAAVIVFGPFMPPAMQRQFRERAARLGAHRRRDLRHARRAADGARGRRRRDGRLQHVLRDSLAGQACDPRPAGNAAAGAAAARQSRGRARARAHARPRGVRDPAVMAAALRGLAQQPAPSERGAAQMLGGLDLITELVAGHVGGSTLLQAHAAGT